MSSGLVNITKHLKSQGLSPLTRYEGVVIDNNDPERLCRLRIRVKRLLDGIPDSCLPWAIPGTTTAITGAYIAGWDNDTPDTSQEHLRSGSYSIPEKGCKVTVRYMGGDIHYPIWFGYTVDEKVVLKNELEGGSQDRYPHRAVVRMRNGGYIIVDKETSEVFINAAGDVHLTVLGDVHETIVGNKTTQITSRITDIPEYIRKAPASYLDRLKRNTQGKVPWAGSTPYRKQGGNHHVYIEGDETVVIGGNRIVTVAGSVTETAKGDHTVIAKKVNHGGEQQQNNKTR